MAKEEKGYETCPIGSTQGGGQPTGQIETGYKYRHAE